jgi:hypothetical protein
MIPETARAVNQKLWVAVVLFGWQTFQVRIGGAEVLIYTRSRAFSKGC